MKHIQRAIALSGLLVLLTFTSALAQSDRQTIIHIPFHFTVGEKMFTAGEYVIAPNRRDSTTVWVIRHKDGSGATFFLTQPVYSVDPQEKTKLVFHRYEDLYFLSEVWTAGSETGREIQISDREKTLDKVLASKRQETVLMAQGK
jgi:hypothetical protein